MSLKKTTTILALLLAIGVVRALAQDDFDIADASWREYWDPQEEQAATTTTTTEKTTTTTTTTKGLAQRIKEAAILVDELAETFLYVVIGLCSCVATAIAVFLHIRSLCARDPIPRPAADAEEGQLQPVPIPPAPASDPVSLAGDENSAQACASVVADPSASPALSEDEEFFDAAENV